MPSFAITTDASDGGLLVGFAQWASLSVCVAGSVAAVVACVAHDRQRPRRMAVEAALRAFEESADDSVVDGACRCRVVHGRVQEKERERACPRDGHERFFRLYASADTLSRA